MLKIEFDASNLQLAAALGRALTEYANPRHSEAAAETVDTAAKHEPEPQTETVDEAAAADMQTETADETPETAGTADAKVDEHGVPFDPEYCGKSSKPFYASGPNKGQWKKKKGVDESAYNEWYESMRPDPVPEQHATQEETTGNAAAAAFGAQEQAQQQQADAPTDVPSLMKWVAEQTAAGNITQADVTKAWDDVGVSFGNVFTLPADQQSAVVAQVFAKLIAK